MRQQSILLCSLFFVQRAWGVGPLDRDEVEDQNFLPGHFPLLEAWHKGSSSAARRPQPGSLWEVAEAMFAYLEPEGIDPCNAGKLYSLWAR